MNCRSNIIINNKLIYICINTSGDFNYLRDIPLKEWFQLLRYEIGLIETGAGKRKWFINKSKSIWQ